MKINFPVAPPSEVKEGWIGQFKVFSWYTFVLNIPTAVYIITTRKENGLPNAQLNAWGMLVGSGTEPKFLLQLMNTSDTLRLIQKNREYVINVPNIELAPQFGKTTIHYPEHVDEITASGLTAEPSTVVTVPRVAECYAHYECILDWLQPIETNKPINTLVQGSIVNATVDDAYLLPDLKETFSKRAIPYHFSEFYNHSQRSISSGDTSGFCQLDIQTFDVG